MNLVLKNIKSVSAIESYKLANITIVPVEHGYGVLLNYWRDFASLPVSGLSEVTVATSISNKSRIYTVKLSSFLTDTLDIDNKKYCYLVTDVKGVKYLIGSNEDPFPITNMEEKFPGKESDRGGWQLNVEYKNSFGLLEVLD